MLTHTASMLRLAPYRPTIDEEALVRCIDACTDCAQTCTACADACLGEASVAHLVTCIRLNLNCADVCVATAAVLSRAGGNATDATTLVEACAAACRACAEECDRHASIHEHC